MRVPPHPDPAESQVHAVGHAGGRGGGRGRVRGYDALDLIAVDYEPLPGLAEPEAPWRAARHAVLRIDGNRALTRIIREGDAQRAFAAAAHVVPLRVAQNRISAVAMEPRSVLATSTASPPS